MSSIVQRAGVCHVCKILLDWHISGPCTIEYGDYGQLDEEEQNFQVFKKNGSQSQCGVCKTKRKQSNNRIAQAH